MNSREQFEAWIKSSVGEIALVKDDIGEYESIETTLHFVTWQERDRLAKLERDELIMQCSDIAMGSYGFQTLADARLVSNLILALLEVKE
jgi:hypothetical protein